MGKRPIQKRYISFSLVLKDTVFCRILSTEMAEWVKAFTIVLSSIPRTYVVEDKTPENGLRPEGTSTPQSTWVIVFE